VLSRDSKRKKRNRKINVYVCVWGRGEQEKKAIMILGCFFKNSRAAKAMREREGQSKDESQKF
jgi:hypothetical protein